MAAGDEHTVFVSGDDAVAKSTVVGLLHGIGWQDVIDLGPRVRPAAEMMLPMWLRLMAALGGPEFQCKIAR